MKKIKKIHKCRDEDLRDLLFFLTMFTCGTVVTFGFLQYVNSPSAFGKCIADRNSTMEECNIVRKYTE